MPIPKGNILPETEKVASVWFSARYHRRVKGEGLMFAAVKFSADTVDVLIGCGSGEEEEEDPLVSEYKQDPYELVVDYQNYYSG